MRDFGVFGPKIGKDPSTAKLAKKAVFLLLWIYFGQEEKFSCLVWARFHPGNIPELARYAGTHHGCILRARGMRFGAPRPFWAGLDPGRTP